MSEMNRAKDIEHDLISVVIDFNDLCKAINHLQAATALVENNKPKKPKKKARLMSVREVSRYLQIKSQVLYYLVESKSIPFIKKKDYLYFDKDEIQKWFAEKENRDLMHRVLKSSYFK